MATRARQRTPATKRRRVASPSDELLELELATLVEAPPAGADWLHEIKLDGYRIVARIEHGEAQLFTRRGNDWTSRATSVTAALAALPVENAVIDGEVVSLRGDGVSDFQALQNALSAGRSQSLSYFAFDLMFLNGQDLRALPLRERKEVLAALLAGRASEHLRLSEHVEGQGQRMFDQACKLGLEGTIAKRADSSYRAGRGRDWLKIKCIARQEFVIAGYTPPSGSRAYIGALLIGVREAGKLRYAGKVGTGFTVQSLRDLHARLTPLERAACPFATPPKGSDVKGAKWVEPRLVAEVAFTEFTADGRLRHPSFQGLREDKPAAAVVRERPAKPEARATKGRPRAKGRSSR